MKFALFAAAALSLATAVPASAASLVGDTVNGTYYFPDASTVYQNDGSQVVSPTASFFFSTGYPNVTATVSGDQITLSFDAGGGTYNSATFSGVVITDLTNSAISGVSLDSSTNLPGFTASDLSFTGDSVSLNLEGLPVPSESNIVVADLSFGGAVPEPATWAMMMLGLFGVGAVLRNRREFDGAATVA